MPEVQVNNYVRVKGRPDLGTGEVVRICEDSPDYRADVAFEGPNGRRLETIPVSRLEKVLDLWERLAHGDFDDPVDYALKQLVPEFRVRADTALARAEGQCLVRATTVAGWKQLRSEVRHQPVGDVAGGRLQCC
jgi:hypothetical protein